MTNAAFTSHGIRKYWILNLNEGLWGLHVCCLLFSVGCWRFRRELPPDPNAALSYIKCNTPDGISPVSKNQVFNMTDSHIYYQISSLMEERRFGKDSCFFLSLQAGDSCGRRLYMRLIYIRPVLVISQEGISSNCLKFVLKFWLFLKILTFYSQFFTF